jgi:predicted metalloprotease with PDZ domain
MHYLIEAHDLNAHLFHIQLTLPASATPTLLKLPVWIPGSYMVREFSRHVVRISARAAKRAVAVEQVKKNAWRVAAASSERVVSYAVYAFDQSVRTAWLDAERGFFNGSSVFLYSDETRHTKHIVEIAAPADARCKDWQVCTTLKRGKSTKHFGFGEYEAADYDELIDKPVTLCNFQILNFKAHGIAHEIVITGMGAIEGKRLSADVQRICEAQIAMFDPKHKQAPFERYVFMLHASGDGYGGLEHRDCTALIAKRADLPQPGVAEMSDGYATLLGLFSHEYFHAWNVKRIKPQRFEPYDLERENLTRLLWLFEGFTSYYDDLLLLRAGVIDEARYLKLLSKNITTVLSMPGRHVESVADASFNAWIKYYRADENTPNTTISYYQKGALVALAIDAMLRRDTKHTLDDVMRYLYTRFLQSKPGVGEDEMPALLHEKFGLDKKTVQNFFEHYVNDTQDLPLQALLSSLSCALHEVSDSTSGNTTLGGRLDARDEGVFVAMVFTAGALQQAGLARGDVIVALDGEQCNRARWESVRQKLKPKRASALHYFRDGLLRETTLTPHAPGIKEWSVQRAADVASTENSVWPHR